jgi:isopentenyl diphosphate isomerase/L-lactate dehydrogenase-like FMN-dependent dehydrogenase
VTDLAGLYREIYARGLNGEKPPLPMEWEALEAAAADALDASAHAFIFAGAGTNATMRANRDAFDAWRIVPRVLRDVAERDLRTTVLGTEMPAPLMLAPIGVQSLAHPEGELATARAASAVGLPMVGSTSATHTMEQSAEANGDGARWYQLFWPNDDAVTRSMLERAEAAGYSALVVTLDTDMLGWRPQDLQEADLPFLRGVGNQNFFSDPGFCAGLERPPEEDMGAAIGHYVDVFFSPGRTWDDLEDLRSMTSLPIVLKGIQHPDDAAEAVRRGIDGVACSNHGGRQVDGAIGTLDALPAIVEAVDGRAAVLLDGGVRCGADVFKALALGADAVMLGRPYLWGLTLGGQAGVEWVLRCMLAELDATMGLSGLRSVAELTPDALVRMGEGPRWRHAARPPG